MQAQRRFNPALLLRYLLTYAGIFLLVVGLLLLLRKEVLSVTRRNVLASRQLRVQEGMDRFSELTSRMLATMYILRNDPDVQRLMALSGTADTPYVPHILGAQKMVSYVKTLLSDDILSCYVVFRHNDLLISNTTSGSSNPTQYGRILSYSSLDGIAWYARLFASPLDVSFWPETTVLVPHLGFETGTRVLTCVVKLKDRTTLSAMGALAFLLDKDRMADLLIGDEFRSDAALSLMDSAGTALLEYGASPLPLTPEALAGGETLMLSGEPHILLSAASPLFELSAWVAIPSRLIDQQVGEVLRLISLYIWLGLAAGLAVVLLYASRHYVQVTRLLNVSQQVAQREYRHINEYRFIGDVLRDIASANDAASQRLVLIENERRMRLLEDACLRGIYTHAERAQLRTVLGDRLQGFRVLAVSYEEGEGHAAYEAEEHLALRTNGVTLRTGKDEIVCILAAEDSEEDRERIQTTARQILAVFTARDANVAIGISARGSSISDLHRCYRQAKRALALEGESGAFGVHWGEAAPEAGLSFDLYTPQALYNLLVAGDEDGVARLFQSILSQPHLSGMAYLQAFGSLRLSMERAGHEAALSVELPPFAADEPYAQAMAQLQACAAQMVRAVQNSRTSSNGTLKNAMLSYIREKYRDPNLTAAMIAERFDLSEKYVFHFLKEQTGRTLGDHIEDARLEAAGEYLLKTDLSNEEIAQRAGFGTAKTFYRAFKRRHGVTPGTWRERR